MLAGYISANRVDLALVQKTGDTISLTNEMRFVSRDFNGLEGILRVYFKKFPGEITTACFGVAGPVIGDEVRPTNLPWHVAGRELAEHFGIHDIKLVNDVVATGYGISHLDAEDLYVINEGMKPSVGSIGLIAAGSGLGEAIIFGNGEDGIPYASEGGHADFAPGNQIEAELWEYVYSELGQVEAEDIVSWAGLERIYLFLADTEGAEPEQWYLHATYKSDAIIEHALSGQDDRASRALDIFIDCYASEAANLALKGMTLGGIYVGGQIAPRIITALDRGRFMERFIKKGKMDTFLASMPVRVIIEDRTALIGAAAIARSLK